MEGGVKQIGGKFNNVVKFENSFHTPYVGGKSVSTCRFENSLWNIQRGDNAKLQALGNLSYTQAVALLWDKG